MLESSTLEPASAETVRTELLWPDPPADLRLQSAEVHVFATWLDACRTIDRMRLFLSRDEKLRAGRFRFERDRNRFIVARAWLRAVLAHYLEISPAKIVFSYGPSGKPVLAGALAGSELQFNLAHSGALALLAVTTTAPIGIDVEHTRSIPEAEQLVCRFFSPREADFFHELEADARPAAFFNLWTRKEALLKATGEGIAHSLNRVEVSFLSHEPARLLSLPPGTLPLSRWTLRELHPAMGFTAALAVASFPILLRSFSWPTEANL